MSKLNDCGANPIYTHIPNPICHNKGGYRIVNQTILSRVKTR